MVAVPPAAAAQAGLAVEAQRPLLAHPLQLLVLLALALLAKDVVLLAQPPQVLVLLALALPAKDAVVRVQFLLLVLRPLLAQAPREAAVAEEAVELLSRPSFSAAMARTTPCPAPAPTYERVPRSR